MNTLLFPAIHFVALIGFLTYKLSPSFSEFIRSRHLLIAEGLSKSEAQAKLALERQKEVEQKISRMGEQKNSVVAEWKKREAEQIAMIRESSQKVLQQMKIDSERNQNHLLEQLRGETIKSIGRLIMNRAMEKISLNMTSEKRQKLNQEFIGQIQGAASRVDLVQGAQRT